MRRRGIVSFTSPTRKCSSLRPRRRVKMPRGMKRISHRWFGVAVLLALVVIATCGAGRVVIPFTIDPATIAVPRDARSLTNHEAAVRGLTAILIRELGLPMPATFTLYVYGGRQPFEHGLVHDAQGAPSRAAELSGFAVGISKRRQLLLHEDGSLPTYQLAFLMADYLIERDGFPRVVDYFKSFERRQDRHSNFRDIFGQSLDQFEREVLAHLKTVVR